MLSRDEFLAFKDTRIGRVEVPELGGEVCLANLTVAESDQIRKFGESDDAPVAVWLVIMGICDDEGKRLFTKADAKKLCELPATVVSSLAKAVLEHNGLNLDAGEEAKND